MESRLHVPGFINLVVGSTRTIEASPSSYNILIVSLPSQFVVVFPGARLSSLFHSLSQRCQRVLVILSLGPHRGCRSDIIDVNGVVLIVSLANESLPFIPPPPSLPSARPGRRVIPVASLITKDANTKSYTKTDSQWKIMKGFEINIRRDRGKTTDENRVR